MFCLHTFDKDAAIDAAIQRKVTKRHDYQIDKKSAPGGLRMVLCSKCHRSIYANHHGHVFGSALREDCNGHC